MNWDTFLYPADEQPLDRLVNSYSHTAVFRTMAFIGDSLSSGEFETRDSDGTPAYHDLYDYSWGQYIARKNGLKAYNFSRGGMTAKEYMESFAKEQGFWDDNKACQAYVLALGVNDLLNRGMEVGCVEDIDTDRDTFARWYAQIIQRYQAMCPDAVFFLVTIPKSDDPLVEEKSAPMRKLLYDLQARFDRCYILDLYQYGPVYDARFREAYYLHGHMNPAGYLLTARLIDSYIDYIVRHNPDVFRTIGLVGSGIPF